MNEQTPEGAKGRLDALVGPDDAAFEAWYESHDAETTKDLCRLLWRHRSAEIERLRAALDWYAEMAKQMQRATLHGDSQYMLGMMKELAVDGGKKARDAVPPNDGFSREPRSGESAGNHS